MKVIQYFRSEDFLADNLSLLQQAEAANNLIIGLAYGIQTQKYPPEHFTPKPYRKKGYASSCVAFLCQTLLEQGYTFCSLFTDASNPTSNKIYQNIGFREVAKFQSIDFLSGE